MATTARTGATVGENSLSSAFAQGLSLAEAADAEGSALEGAATDFGHYDGLPAKIVLLPDGRGATLIDQIAFHRTDGSDWPVPPGAALDGTSIPRAFWTAIGGPFEGEYRDASIVHDFYCDAKSRRWEDTHRMFHDAMRCSGVGKVKASIMFYAVYRFGPRWPEPGLENLGAPSTPPRDQDAAAFALDVEAIADRGLSPDEIAALADARRAAAAQDEAAPAAVHEVGEPGSQAGSINTVTRE